MAIRIQHTPVRQLGDLATQAGRGDDFRFRFGAARQLEQQMEGERANRIQEALAMQRLQQQDRQFQQQMARDEVQFAAQQQFRQQQLAQQAAMSSRAQRLAEQRAAQGAYEFEQMLPIQQLRADAYATQADRAGIRATQAITDPKQLPQWKKAAAAQGAIGQQLKTAEAKYDDMTQQYGSVVMPKQGHTAAQVEAQAAKIAQLRIRQQQLAEQQEAIAEAFDLGEADLVEAAAVNAAAAAEAEFATKFAEEGATFEEMDRYPKAAARAVGNNVPEWADEPAVYDAIAALAGRPPKDEAEVAAAAKVYEAYVQESR